MTDPKVPMTREERLAARLRENLKRRKAQARALEGGAQPQSESPDSLLTSVPVSGTSGLSKPAT
ncbi:MAG: hypothetical protein ACK4UL_13515 [Novosphingobium meiothermophilum]|uniref:hypothetical protein n=1 Tax=Novosphingobium TaxID=165696 RepID=UPI000D6DE15D|nr:MULTISPECIES: hypothetical protein [Novosphingobium]